MTVVVGFKFIVDVLASHDIDSWSLCLRAVGVISAKTYGEEQ